MYESFSHENIDEILKIKREFGTPHAIKALRNIMPFGLREAYDILNDRSDGEIRELLRPHTSEEKRTAHCPTCTCYKGE